MTYPTRIRLIGCLSLLIFSACAGETKTAFYPNGQVKQELPTNADGRLNGTSKYYSIDGRLLRERDYDDGRLQETRHCDTDNGDC